MVVTFRERKKGNDKNIYHKTLCESNKELEGRYESLNFLFPIRMLTNQPEISF